MMNKKTQIDNDTPHITEQRINKHGDTPQGAKILLQDN